MVLNEDTFPVIAMKYYDNPSCSGVTEFYDDLKRFQYIQKLFKRKHKNKFFNSNLALNHMITLYNLFGQKATELLFFKIEKEYWPYLKTFIVFLNYMPDRIQLNNESIYSTDIVLDEEIIGILRKI